MTTEGARLIDLLYGFFPAQVIQTMARLSVPDQLASGPMPVAELAGATGTHEPSLNRLLRAAEGLDLVERQAGGTVRLTAGGELLRSDTKGSIRNLAMLFCGSDVWRSWGQLEFSVRTGRPSYSELLGTDSFDRLSGNPDEQAIFTEAMAEGTRAAAPGVVASCDLSGTGRLADLGGGNGTLLAALLNANPSLEGVLFDTRAGIAEAPRVLAEAGVADRVEIVPGDFFEKVPEGCDAHLLKSVIHDWDDERALAILRNCRAAMPVGGTLLVVEPVLPSGGAGLGDAKRMLMSDLNMLVCTGGRERTDDEFQDLLAGAGFSLESVTKVPPPTSYSVLRAVPA
jgi:orsellinic acid C2-O-methyltransferase